MEDDIAVGNDANSQVKIEEHEINLNSIMAGPSTNPLAWQQEQQVGIQNDVMDQDFKDEDLKNILGASDFLEDYKYKPLALDLNNDQTVLFADPTSSNHEITYWITGQNYSHAYQQEHGRTPTIEHMDNVPSIVKDGRGNYFPKATLEYNCVVPGKKAENTKYWERRDIAAGILQANGLSGDLYSGMVKQSSGNYDLPVEKRIFYTPTGPRPQQRQYKYPEHAGVANQNQLLIKQDGIICSFDIKPNGSGADTSLVDKQKELGGRLYLKSERSNGYHSIDYLNKRDGENAAQKRYDHLLGKGGNKNQELPEVGILINGTLCNAHTVLELRQRNPQLVDALRNGVKQAAPLVKIRSPNGGYWTPEYAAKTNPKWFAELMKSRGINAQIGRHDFTAAEQKENRKNLPNVLINTGKGVLVSDQKIRTGELKENETIASKYTADKILVANKGEDQFSSGFYTQLGVAARDLQNVHAPALAAIHRTKDGHPRPDLADQTLSTEGQSRLPANVNQRGNGNPSRYEPRNDRNRSHGRGS